MTLSVELQNRLMELSREFADQSRLKVDEMADALDASADAQVQDLPPFVRSTLHDIKGQAGTFGYPLISDIARVAEQYIETASQDDVTKKRHVRALLEMMRNLLSSTDGINDMPAHKLQMFAANMQERA